MTALPTSYTADELVEMDLAFIARMRRAILRGRERATFGIKIDRTPLRATAFYPQSRGSGCGSPAAQCSDTAENDDHELG